MAAEPPVPAPDGPIGITVVTVALNAARDLALTIESVHAQDYPHIELVVVDGMSWDETPAILARYADAIHTLVSAADAGTYHAMNDALAHATGDYVVFMNAGDTFFAADAVSRTVAALEGRPDIFYGNHIYVGGGIEYFRRSAPFEWIGGQLAAGTIDHAWHAAIPCHQATFTHTGLLRRLRYDTGFRIGADHDLLFRAYEQGATTQYVDEIVAHYQGGGISATQGARCRAENVAVYRRFTAHPAAVDRLFYPEGSPFAAHNARTGLLITELLAPASPEPARTGWVAGEGCRFVSPDRWGTALTVTGENPFDRQRIEAFVDDAPVGAADIPTGAFAVTILFDAPLPAASIVTLQPSRYGALDAAPGSTAAFALADFAFESSGGRQLPLLHPGMRLAFLDSGFAEMRGSGWFLPEVDHIWSAGPRSELWVKPSHQVARLHLTGSGNPFVARGSQDLRVLVNGRELPGITLPATVRTGFSIDCTGPAWHAGQANQLLLLLSDTASSDTDERDFGFCLWGIDTA